MATPSNIPSNSSKSKRVAVHVIIRGRVQGVGYRYFAQAKALEAGLTGWVRNTPQGEVEAVAQGSPSTIESWLQDLRKGPPLARVDTIATDRIEVSDKHLTFTINI